MAAVSLARASLELVPASFSYELVCHVAACVWVSMFAIWKLVFVSIAIFFEVRPIHACTLAPLWTVRPTSGNRRRIALATQGARSVTAVSCPPDPCKKIRRFPSRCTGRALPAPPRTRFPTTKALPRAPFPWAAFPNHS